MPVFRPMKQSSNSAVVLLSGGLDSTTTLAIAAQKFPETYALTVSYGQKNTHEMRVADTVANLFNVKEHKTINLDLSAFGGSSLTTKEPVERNRNREEIGQGIPSTYVPARNTLFLSLALSWAEALGVVDIFIGVNSVDWSGYPDCRPEYIKAFTEMANLATKMTTEGKKITIHTPLINLTKSEIIQQGTKLGVDYSKTNTCYDPGAEGNPCGTCDACTLRQQGFLEAGLVDPLNYQTTV